MSKGGDGKREFARNLAMHLISTVDDATKLARSVSRVGSCRCFRRSSLLRANAWSWFTRAAEFQAKIASKLRGGYVVEVRWF